MIYLESFKLPSAKEEHQMLMDGKGRFRSLTLNTDPYPFRLFIDRIISELTFEPITIFYGGNGSGKSTLLNLIANKLDLKRSSLFNEGDFFEEYSNLCSYSLKLIRPNEIEMIASDDIFDHLQMKRSINNGISRHRSQLYDDYYDLRKNEEGFTLRSLEDYERLKEINDAKRSTYSRFTSSRTPKKLLEQSNGESAYDYFLEKIIDGGLYLLDEPENSLSAPWQIKLAEYIEESARFYKCQFIISTHSPFILSIKGAKIYNLDSIPIEVQKWTELENVRVYYDFFQKHKDKF